MTNDNRIRFRLDRRARWITLLALLVVGGGLAFLFHSSGGSYLPAWFTILIVAILLLALLSVPRFMRVSPHSVEIHCLMELIKIPLADIREIRVVENSRMRFCFPIWGIYGVLGYYGYYFDLRDRRIFRLYSGSWRNFVLIEDIYEEQIVIGCDDPADFIRQIGSFR